MKNIYAIIAGVVMVATSSDALADPTVNIYLNNKTQESIYTSASRASTAKLREDGEKVVVAPGKKMKIGSLSRIPEVPGGYTAASANITIAVSIGNEKTPKYYITADTTSSFSKGYLIDVRENLNWAVKDSENLLLKSAGKDKKGSCNKIGFSLSNNGYMIESECSGLDLMAAPDITFTISK